MNTPEFHALHMVTISSTSPAMETAARWWADVLDERHADKREAFYRALVAVAKAEQERWPGGTVYLETDYNLCQNLANAARAAGIEENEIRNNFGLLPRKCTVRIMASGRVSVWPGYQAGWHPLN